MPYLACEYFLSASNTSLREDFSMNSKYNEGEWLPRFDVGTSQWLFWRMTMFFHFPCLLSDVIKALSTLRRNQNKFMTFDDQTVQLVLRNRQLVL